MLLRLITLLTAFFLFAAPAVLAQEEVTLEPSKDNTLFEDAAGNVSNGAGDHLFAGMTATSAIRRAVLAFDVDAAVPDGAEIESVTLDLNMSKTISAARTISVHRLTADWGEGTSNALAQEGTGAASTDNDATWIHGFYDTVLWSSPGGDYESSATATFSVGNVGSYEASSQGMADDVQAWLDDPSINFGWILIGDESTSSTAKRFDSREHVAAGNRPQLIITYSTGVGTERPDLPTTLQLDGNYPNPFTASTTIHYNVEQAQPVSLTLFDVLGREVREVVRGYQAAGEHQISVAADGLPAGTYIYCLSGGECGRMTLVP